MECFWFLLDKHEHQHTLKFLCNVIFHKTFVQNNEKNFPEKRLSEEMIFDKFEVEEQTIQLVRPRKLLFSVVKTVDKEKNWQKTPRAFLLHIELGRFHVKE